MILLKHIAPDLLNSKLIDDKEIENLKTYHEKCNGLMKMISRDRMKVVFFGRYGYFFFKPI